MAHDVPPPHLEQVSPGIHAWIQPDGSWFLNNTGFLVGSETVVMIDQCGTEARARGLMDAIASTSDRPVQALVNTHHHGDHTFGNYVVPTGATVIGHHLTRHEIIATGTATADLFEGPDWGHLEIRPPMLTFDERISMWVDDLEVELIHFGTPAHTTNDVVAWIPERGVLFTGDLLFHRGTPFALQGSVTGWLQVLGSLRALGAETMVPGHGPVGDESIVDAVQRYLEWLGEIGTAGFEAGKAPLEVAREADLGEFAELADAERIVGNLHRLYAELGGAPLGTGVDLRTAFADMVTYNGGPIHSCA